jgi:hypothetical protein
MMTMTKKQIEFLVLVFVVSYLLTVIVGFTLY